MKLLKKISLSFITAFLMAATSLNAQVEMEWDSHGVGFEVPSNFTIETNNGDEFTAANNNVFLTILPIEDEDVTEDDLIDALIVMAEEMDFDNISDADEVSIDDFIGYYVEGEKDGANSILATLLDEESSTNLLIVVAFNDGHRNKAVDIINSVYAYD